MHEEQEVLRPDLADDFFKAAITNGNVKRQYSMELVNDPRFFHANVVDKRLTAVISLVVINGLMLGTSLAMLFSLNKDTQNDGSTWCFILASSHLAGYWGLSAVALASLMGAYTICQQLYHIYRLMTVGPTGIEAAGMYYLMDSVVLWRHSAVNLLLNGMVGFVVCTGLVLFNKIIADGNTMPQCFVQPVVPTAVLGQNASSVQQQVASNSTVDHENAIDLEVGNFHVAFPVFTLCLYVLVMALMCHIRGVHKKHFKVCFHLTTETRAMTAQFSGMSLDVGADLGRFSA